MEISLPDIEACITTGFSGSDCSIQDIQRCQRILNDFLSHNESISFLVQNYNSFQNNSSRVFTLSVINQRMESMQNLAQFLFGNAIPSEQLSYTQALFFKHFGPFNDFWSILPNLPNLRSFLYELKDFLFSSYDSEELRSFIVNLCQAGNLSAISAIASILDPALLVPLIGKCIEEKSSFAVEILTVLVKKTGLELDLGQANIPHTIDGMPSLACVAALRSPIEANVQLCFSFFDNGNDESALAVSPFIFSENNPLINSEEWRAHTLGVMMNRINQTENEQLREKLIGKVKSLCDQSVLKFLSFVDSTDWEVPENVLSIFDVLNNFKNCYLFGTVGDPHIQILWNRIKPIMEKPPPFASPALEAHQSICQLFQFIQSDALMFDSLLKHSLCCEYDSCVHEHYSNLLLKFLSNPPQFPIDLNNIHSLLVVGLSAVAAKLFSYCEPQPITPFLNDVSPIAILHFIQQLPQTHLISEEILSILGAIPITSEEIVCKLLSLLYYAVGKNGFQLFHQCFEFAKTTPSLEIWSSLSSAASKFMQDDSIPNFENWRNSFLVHAFTFLAQCCQSIAEDNSSLTELQDTWNQSENQRIVRQLIMNCFLLLNMKTVKYLQPGTLQQIGIFITTNAQLFIYLPNELIYIIRAIEFVQIPDFPAFLGFLESNKNIFQPQVWRKISGEIAILQRNA